MLKVKKKERERERGGRMRVRGKDREEGRVIAFLKLYLQITLHLLNIS